MVLLTVGSQCLVQIVFGNRPRRPLDVCASVLVRPQYQRAGNHVVDMPVSWNGVLLIGIIINDLYPGPVHPDPVNHLSIQRVPHVVGVYKKFSRISSFDFRYLNVPPLE